MKWTIEKEIEGYDMVIQRDGPGEGELCAGFFACQANEAVKELWLKVHEIMKADAKRDDQQPLNHLLKGRATKVRWKRLPNDFLSGGTLHTELWVPGKIIPAPVTVILHHANWTFGIDNKLAQLKQVRETVQRPRRQAGRRVHCQCRPARTPCSCASSWSGASTRPASRSSAPGDVTDDDVLNGMGDQVIGTITAHMYSAAHPSAMNKDYVAAMRKANNGLRPNFMSVGGYDGMHLMSEALKRTNGATGGDALLAAMKGMAWESPRGPISIDPETRDIVQNIYMRKVEKVDGAHPPIPDKRNRGYAPVWSEPSLIHLPQSWARSTWLKPVCPPYRSWSGGRKRL